MQDRDVGQSLEDLGVSTDQVVVEEIDELVRVVARARRGEETPQRRTTTG